MTQPSEHAVKAASELWSAYTNNRSEGMSDQQSNADLIQVHAIDPAVAELVDLVSRLHSALFTPDAGETDSPLDIEARKVLERHK